MKILNKIFLTIIAAVLLAGCQKIDRPVLGDYPKDANPLGGPLKFYAAFDGATDDPLMNAVDSIMANFPSDNPFKTIEGVSSKAVEGVNKTYIKYAKPNDWAIKAKSFTIALWYKNDAQTNNNKGTNGPEYFVSLKSNNGHWSGANMFFFLEGSNTSCAVKFMVVDKNMNDKWFEWVGDETLKNTLDNQWHHIAAVYDAGTSSMTLYSDGVAHPVKKVWDGHGDMNIDDLKISEMRIGCGPANNFDGDDWLSSTWKGGIDQFRMYDKALSAAEVTELYNGKK